MNSIFRLFTIIRVIWAFGLYQLPQYSKKLIIPQKQSKRVFSNALHPGAVATNIWSALKDKLRGK